MYECSQCSQQFSTSCNSRCINAISVANKLVLNAYNFNTIILGCVIMGTFTYSYVKNHAFLLNTGQAFCSRYTMLQSADNEYLPMCFFTKLPWYSNDYFSSILSTDRRTDYSHRQNKTKIFRRKRLSTGANFVHVYIEIWDKGILKFNKFSM